MKSFKSGLLEAADLYGMQITAHEHEAKRSSKAKAPLTTGTCITCTTKKWYLIYVCMSKDNMLTSAAMAWDLEECIRVYWDNWQICCQNASETTKNMLASIASRAENNMRLELIWETVEIVKRERWLSSLHVRGICCLHQGQYLVLTSCNSCGNTFTKILHFQQAIAIGKHVVF